MRLDDGMRCCRSDWPGLCFVVINPRVLSANRVDLGFLFHKFSILPPPPAGTEGAGLLLGEIERLITDLSSASSRCSKLSNASPLQPRPPTMASPRWGDGCKQGQKHCVCIEKE